MLSHTPTPLGVAAGVGCDPFAKRLQRVWATWQQRRSTLALSRSLLLALSLSLSLSLPLSVDFVSATFVSLFSSFLVALLSLSLSRSLPELVAFPVKNPLTGLPPSEKWLGSTVRVTTLPWRLSRMANLNLVHQLKLASPRLAMDSPST